MSDVNLPKRVGYQLKSLERLWNVERDALSEWVCQGDLQTHVRLPLMSVFQIQEIIDGNRVRVERQLRHWEGYTPLSKYSCRLIFQHSCVHLRDFVGEEGERLCLPETVREITIQESDLIVLVEECQRFERTHGLIPIRSPYGLSEKQPVNTDNRHRANDDFDPSFRCVCIDGEDHSFTRTQAKFLSLLYEAALNGEPWQSGKQVLQRAGSESFSPSSIFKRSQIWRRIVEKNTSGEYRIDPKILARAKDGMS